jgi:hypothetical protein
MEITLASGGPVFLSSELAGWGAATMTRILVALCALTVGIVLAFGILASSSISWAAEFFYMGVGATSCGKIADNYRQNPTLWEGLMLTWAQGFMSGANTGLNGEYRDLNALSVDAQKQSLLSYCDQHPMAEFIKAAIELYLKLPLKKMPPPH